MIGFRRPALALAALAFAAPALAQDAQPRRITEPQWLSQPLAGDFAWAYPKEAFAAKVDGQVLLDCGVNSAGRLFDCRETLEVPEGRGFGEAARNIAGLYRMAKETPDGASTAGARVDVPVRFDWRGRSGDPKIAGAPEADLDRLAEDGARRHPLVALAGALAGIIGLIVLFVLDRRQRGWKGSAGAAISEGFRFLPSMIRRAPVPLALTTVAGVLAYPFGPLGELGRAGLSLLTGVTGIFTMAAAYRLFYRDRGAKYPPAPGVGGLEFGMVEGAVWVSGLLVGLLTVIGFGCLTLLIFLGSRLQAPVAGVVVAVIVGLAIAGFIVAVARLTFVAPLAAYRAQVDVRAGWNFGLGRLLSVVAISIVTSFVLVPAALLSIIIGIAGGPWWLGGLIYGSGYAIYYAIFATILASLVVQQQGATTTI